MIKPEILSPAGDMECLQSALSFGADAVFLAGKLFGMRSSPKNFDKTDLKKACELAHSLGKKIHLTCNILPRNSELSALPDFLSYHSRDAYMGMIEERRNVYHSYCSLMLPNLIRGVGDIDVIDIDQEEGL